MIPHSSDNSVVMNNLRQHKFFANFADFVFAKTGMSRGKLFVAEKDSVFFSAFRGYTTVTPLF